MKLYSFNFRLFLQTQQQCPPRSEITPCSCTVKKNGLDILCEFTDSQHINRAMETLKGKSFVIFYLKLRHNNLPKLQGFIFLGLDIRHLTIHNSSLAVVEESSLTSIGEYSLPTSQIASPKLQLSATKLITTMLL